MHNNSDGQTARILFAKAPPLSCCRVATIAFTASVVLLGCGKRPARDDNPSSVGSVASPTATVKLAQVEVPVEGKQFSPPVRVEQVPAGAWYCDMGTVHWAQMNEGKHLCPLCKMDLKRKN